MMSAEDRKLMEELKAALFGQEDQPIDACRDLVMENEDDEDDDMSLSEMMELLSRMRSDDEDDEDDEDADDDEDDSSDEDDDGMGSGRDPDQCHNMAVHYARMGKKSQAVKICKKGLENFPEDIDLMADAVKYSSEIGDMDTAGKYYKLMCQRVPMARWNWRGFTFAADFLMMNLGRNEEECRKLIEEYRRFLPFEERGAVALSELESALGNYDESIKVLEETIRTMRNAPQCALRLADVYMERGRFEDVIRAVGYGLSACAETQPSINIPYLYYIRALAQDALLHQEAAEKGSVPAGAAVHLLGEYKRMKKSFPQLKCYQSNIDMRMKMLEFLAAGGEDE